MLIGHQVPGIKRALGAQHPGDAAEMPGGKLPDRVIRVLTRNLFQRAELFVHVKARRVAVIEDIVSQHPQARRDGLRVPADHRFRMAALHQLLHLFRIMKADGDMLLQIQPDLEGSQQPLVFMIFVGGKHVQLLIALADQIHHFLLARQQRRQGFFRVGMLSEQGVFCFAVFSKLHVEQAQGFAQRLFPPQPEPEPVKQPVPQRAEGVDQQWLPHRHIARKA